MIYDYECPKCKKRLEVLQHNYDSQICKCGTEMKRAEVNPFSFALKVYHLTEMPYMGENYSEYEF